MSIKDSIARRAGLSDAKRALLEKRLKGEASSPAAARSVITRCAGEGPEFPASFAQERMWFFQNLAPGNPMYNVPVSVTIRADVDVAVLERVFTDIVSRHESLRTVFRMGADGELKQVVLAPYPVKVEVRDVRDALGADPREGIRRVVAEEGARPIDLENGPLFRVTLLRISEERYALVITLHHIATDGWAYPVVLREMNELYALFRAGQPSPYTAPELRYVDYTVWQRQHLQGENLQKQLSYWRGALEGAPMTEIPGDRPRPPQQTYRGAFYHYFIDEPTMLGMRAVATQESVTLNMVMTAVFYALLQKYTGQGDVVTGTLTGNRARAELEQVMGLFMNTAAVRIDLTDDPTFRELVKRTRKRVLEAQAHQELPFEKLVDELKLPRDLSRNALFQIMYFHHTFVQAHHASEEGRREGVIGLDARPVYEDHSGSLVDTGVSKFDLLMATTERPNGLTGMVEYSTDLYDRDTIARFIDHFCALARAATANPDLPLSRISPLEGEEREKILAWSRGPALEAAFAPIHARFEAQAARTPDAAALESEGGRLTYAELNAWANRIASDLRTRGVAPGAIVGICVDRSAAMVAALLGILKAGAAYLPLDPAYPAERLGFMLRDSGAAVVIAGPGARDALPADAQGVIAVADRPESDDGNPGVEIAPADLAYLIYTSGSTGLPKAVEVMHGNASAFLSAMAREPGLTAGDALLAVTTISFDISVLELFLPLSVGARTVVATREQAADPMALSQMLDAHGATVMQATPSTWRMLIQSGWAGKTDLKILSGGEAMTSELADALLSRSAELWNVYGPTETTVWSTVNRVTEPGERAVVSIGRPIDGERVYVLDEAGNLAPTGIPGELFIAGDGVARGYRGRPELTSERFVPDHIDGREGQRMYRTGDRARWLADGTLEIMGRADQQVKLRGHRVEPGEIEDRIARHPSIAEAAVTVREDVPGQQRLVAYVVGKAGQTPDADALRGWVRETLPEYMVPQTYVALDALPKTPNGKVDRKALPAPAAEGAESRAAYVPPRNPVEEVLARIWAEVLRVERVGAFDNFFALGGDSILSIHVILRASREGIRLQPRHIFQHQTVADLAAVAEVAAYAGAEQGTVAGEAPLTPPQAAFFETTGGAAHFNEARLLRPVRPLEPLMAARAVEAVEAHHDALRMRFERTEDGWRQRNAGLGTEAALEVVNLSGVADDQIAAAIEARAARAQAGLDLENGPVFRAVLFELGPERGQRLLLVAHHLVVDADSWPLLIEDVAQAYVHISRDAGTPDLPAKTTSYRAWAHRLAEYAASPEAAREADFWLNALPADSTLAADHADAADVEGSAQTVVAELSGEETRELLEDAPAAYQTETEDALLAALALAFADVTGRAAPTVDVERDGRTADFEGVEVHRTAGRFSFGVPVHLSVDSATGPGDALKAAKEALRAIPHGGLGYAALRHASPDAEVRRALASRAAQVSLAFRGEAKPADGLLQPAVEPIGTTRSADAPRTHRIEVEAEIRDGRLRAAFTFGAAFERATVERLADAFARSINSIVEHCRSPEAGGFTPSDFADAGLDQASLDALMDRLGGLQL